MFLFINKFPTRYIDEYIFPNKRKNEFYKKDIRVKSSLLINGHDHIIPNKLKKYFNEKIVNKSYINKLCILLSSNDKHYYEKRPILNKLTSTVDINNREYLTKNNFRIIPENNKSIPNEKNNNFHYKNKLNNGLNYIREPRVIINTLSE